MEYKSFKANILTVKEATESYVTTPSEVALAFKDIENLAQETFQILTLNTKRKVIDRHMITLGLMDACLVHSREVFRAAIYDNASSVICVHNHPSGDPTPSAEDIRITRKLIQSGNMIEIPVLDHVIIGHGKHLSMRESGVVDFNLFS